MLCTRKFPPEAARGVLYKACLGDLRVPCQKNCNATAGYYRRELTSAGQLGKRDGFFWEIRRCCDSHGILFLQSEEREQKQKHRCRLQAVKFLLLLFNLGIFLSGAKFSIWMPPEGKAIAFHSLSCFFPCPSTQ